MSVGPILESKPCLPGVEMTQTLKPGLALTCLSIALGLVGCGGGSSSSSPSPSPSPVFPPPSASLSQASTASPFNSSCNGAPQNGQLYMQAEVEPYIAVNPSSPLNVIGIWQQDRWSNGGAQGLIAAASFDAGLTWARHPLPTSNCAGGTAGNGGDYERASDPWLSFSPTGIAYAISLSFNDSNNASAILVTRSSDGGSTWSDPTTLILDDNGVLNDKESITADPTNANYVYAVWDRIDSKGYGPAWFARTTDGGRSWEAARMIYNPGQNPANGNQTLGNQIVVLPDGIVLDMFDEIDYTNGQYSATYKVIRSTDHGTTWSAPIKIADELAVGARDPETGQSIRDGAGLADIAVGPAGNLFVVWQDARFSNGNHDGIALTSSTDGGLRWSTPVRINRAPSTQAFTPSIDVLNDGTLVATYYDLRNNTSDPRTLGADLWQIVSTDGGVHWQERHLSGPFDLELAPDAEGLFLGDYQGLANDGTDPLPLFVRTVTGATGPTDVFDFPPSMSTPLFLAVAPAYAATPAAPRAVGPAFRDRVRKNLARLVKREDRRPGPPPRPSRLRADQRRASSSARSLARRIHQSRQVEITLVIMTEAAKKYSAESTSACARMPSLTLATRMATMNTSSIDHLPSTAAAAAIRWLNRPSRAPRRNTPIITRFLPMGNSTENTRRIVARNTSFDA